MHQELVGTEGALAAAVVLFAGTGKHADAESVASPHSLGTILVVDNDPVLRGLVARFLVLSGYSVLEAHHGAEALDIAQRHTDAIDLLLTDVMMPEMNGFELADAFNQIHPEGQVLYMSGHVADFPNVQEVYETDPSRFLVKPFWAEALLKKIQSILPEPGPAGHTT